MSDTPISIEVREFIDAVTTSGQIWAISDGSDWVVVDSAQFENTDVLPLFSDENLAKATCVDEWADYQPAKITVSEFFESWLENLNEDGVIIGIDWTAALEGVELDPFELAKLMADQEI